MFSQEPCLGVKTNSKRLGTVARTQLQHIDFLDQEIAKLDKEVKEQMYPFECLSDVCFKS
jgi:flagellar motor switch protein FliG